MNDFFESLNEKLTDKQKIIILCGIILLIIFIYIVLKIQTKSDIVIEGDFENHIEDNVDDKVLKSNIQVSKDDAVLEPVEVFVYVCGSVRKPGVVKLNDGQRVYDAIQKVDGMSEDADINSINMARKVLDGEKIYVPKIGEKIEETTNQPEVLSDSMIVNSNSSGLININTSNMNQLEQIPGVGPATARKIIEFRNQNGSFKNIESIKNVSGIGEKKFQAIKTYITI